jgi:CRISPR-associated protein Csx10
MQEIKLTITALAPLAVGKKKPGSVSEAEDYIRGSVIRGAIASYLIQLLGKPEPTDQFYELFINENSAIFRNAYPAKHLLPTTAVSAKNKPGFKPKGEGVFDTLIDRFCAESHGLLYDPSSEDGSRVEPFGGFYHHTDNSNYEIKSVSKRLLTRAGINRRRATSEEEILYSIEVLNEVQGLKTKNQNLLLFTVQFC